MTIDPVDISRDETARADKKKEPQRDRPRERVAGQFLAKYQEKVKIKENEPKKEAPTDSGKKKEPGKEMLARIIEVFKGKEEGEGQDKSGLKKKEEEKKEKTRDGESRTESRSEEDHAPLRAKSSLHEEKGGGRQDSGGHGTGAGGGGGSPSGGGSGSSFQSSTGSRDHKSGGERDQGRIASGAVVRRSGFSDTQGDKREGGGRQLKQKILDEVVESVRIGVNREGADEMTVQLSDDFYGGLKVSVSRQGEGAVVTFFCPNRQVKNTFLFERPRIYAALREKKVAVTRIDVV